ncbi:protein Red [Nephila pilipes]|uniref:Protein Red n=1 Tax=Nephila pilipes TaxID=299642 RepID=A0A8X6QIC1_NEPPI|nr:protein Red [Nephila pilipes]
MSQREKRENKGGQLPIPEEKKICRILKNIDLSTVIGIQDIKGNNLGLGVLGHPRRLLVIIVKGQDTQHSFVHLGDKAKEKKRYGVNSDYQNEDSITSAAGYRAVTPDVKSGLDTAERRRQIIQESKFLGVDMEHTHLVKCLEAKPFVLVLNPNQITIDIVIKKLTQVLSYLRQALLNKKAKKKGKGKLKDLNLLRIVYLEILETMYLLWKTKQDNNADPEKRKSHFEKPRMDDENAVKKNKKNVLKRGAKLISKLEGYMPERYAECHIGASKQYSEYVSNKETLSKAAFRFGVQMADDRKTRTGTGKRNGKKRVYY